MKPSSSNNTRTVLITGGARRIGAALVKAFHQAGMNIMFQYFHSSRQANELARELNQLRPDSVAGISFDLEHFENYQLLSQAVHQQFGRLDVLINNASAFYPTPMDAASETHWNQLLNVNAKAPFFLSNSCKHMLSKDNGAIINLTDIYAAVPLKEYSIYCASKAALTNLTLSLANEFAPQVRVNAIAPGAILAPADKTDEDMATVIEKTPLKRLGGKLAIVETALFLANQACFITGQTINVDGGRSAVNS